MNKTLENVSMVSRETWILFNHFYNTYHLASIVGKLWLAMLHPLLWRMVRLGILPVSRYASGDLVESPNEWCLHYTQGKLIGIAFRIKPKHCTVDCQAVIQLTIPNGCWQYDTSRTHPSLFLSNHGWDGHEVTPIMLLALAAKTTRFARLMTR